MPLPWVSGEPGYGFGPAESAEPWLPQPPSFAALSVAAQQGALGSTPELYRQLLAERCRLGFGAGSFYFVDLRAAGLEADADSLIAFDVRTPHATTRVLVNFGPPVRLPGRAAVLLASDPRVGEALPTDTAVWIARPNSSRDSDSRGS